MEPGRMRTHSFMQARGAAAPSLSAIASLICCITQRTSSRVTAPLGSLLHYQAVDLLTPPLPHAQHGGEELVMRLLLFEVAMGHVSVDQLRACRSRLRAFSQCALCGQLGHIADQCQAGPTRGPMNCAPEP